MLLVYVFVLLQAGLADGNDRETKGDSRAFFFVATITNGRDVGPAKRIPQIQYRAREYEFSLAEM